MADHADPLARFVTQQALTSSRLGVGFVPLSRARPAAQGSSSGSVAPAEPVQVLAPEPTSDPFPSAGSKADRLERLRAKYESDAPHASFVTDFQNIVFGEGDPDARLMFVGEAPGADEDRTGRPFVGRAGQLLDKMIVAMGLSRERVYIANVLKTRPPNNQTPTSDEAQACAPYLYEQIRTVEPDAIVTLGLPATQTLLGVTSPMRELRGRWGAFPPEPLDALGGPIEAGRFRVMPTYHPAFLLRSYTPENRSKVWSDLRLVIDALGLNAPE